MRLQLQLPLVLETLCSEIKERLAKSEPLTWVNDEATQEDIDHLLEQAKGDSKFDPLKLRIQTFEDLQLNKAKLVVKRCHYAKVLAIVYPTTEIPWSTFGKIFQSFGSPSRNIWRLVWFANSSPRLFPTKGQGQGQGQEPAKDPGPANVNGGYASPCRPESIVIYRDEEAARVLVHELLHAACTDCMADPEHIRESKTESWAELFLIAIQSAGKPKKALSLWRKQAQWISDQEYILKNEYNVLNPSKYAWRYTVGRRFVLEGLGCVLPSPSRNPRENLNNSLRFTHPALTL